MGAEMVVSASLPPTAVEVAAGAAPTAGAATAAGEAAASTTTSPRRSKSHQPLSRARKRYGNLPYNGKQEKQNRGNAVQQETKLQNCRKQNSRTAGHLRNRKSPEHQPTSRRSGDFYGRIKTTDTKRNTLLYSESARRKPLSNVLVS